MTVFNGSATEFSDYLNERANDIITYGTPPLYRVVHFHKNPGMYFHNPLEPVPCGDNLYEVLPESTKILADEIADYYKSKLVTRVLTHGSKNIRSKSFDQDLGEALRLNDNHCTKEVYFPILLKLPDFYREDRAVDYLTQEYCSHENPNTSYIGSQLVTVSKLRFVDRVPVRRRAYKLVTFYFADEHRQLVRIPVVENSVNLPVMNLLERAKCFTLVGSTVNKGIHKDHKDFEVLEPVGTNWDIIDLEI